MNPQAKNKEVSCSYELSEKCLVYADLNMTQTIFRNLLSNAIKYTPRGGKVLVKVSKGDNYALIDVIDNGIGIPAELMEGLFNTNKFDSTPGTEQEPGTGFGLVLTSGFVQHNKGEISASSKLGEGTTFHFTLPLTPESIEKSRSDPE